MNRSQLLCPKDKPTTIKWVKRKRLKLSCQECKREKTRNLDATTITPRFFIDYQKQYINSLYQVPILWQKTRIREKNKWG